MYLSSRVIRRLLADVILAKWVGLGREREGLGNAYCACKFFFTNVPMHIFWVKVSMVFIILL